MTMGMIKVICAALICVMFAGCESNRVSPAGPSPESMPPGKIARALTDPNEEGAGGKGGEEDDDVPSLCQFSWIRPPDPDFGHGGLTARRNPRDGCPVLTNPKVCRDDFAPPRVLLGSTELGGYYYGVNLEVQKLDGRSVLSVSVPSHFDVDFVEDCPKATSTVSVVARVADSWLQFTCEALHDWATSRGRPYRQTRIDHRNPCIIDPELLNLSQTEFDAALSQGDVEAVVQFIVVDGAGNTASETVGVVDIPPGDCGASIRRSNRTGNPRIDPIACPQEPRCGLQGMPPSISPVGVGLDFPLESEIDPEEVFLTNADLRVEYTVQVSHSGVCGDPEVIAYADHVTIDGEPLEIGQPIFCPVTHVSGGQVTLSCRLSPKTLHLREESILGLRISSMVRTGSMRSTLEEEIELNIR